jgi:hypothetical protein
MYDFRIYQEQDSFGRTVASYYLLRDENWGRAVWVRSSRLIDEGGTSEKVTIGGVIRSITTKAEHFLDLGAIQVGSEDLFVEKNVYLAADKTDDPSLGVVTFFGFLSLIGLVCGTTLLCPRGIFVNQPLPQRPVDYRAVIGMRVYGTFLQMISGNSDLVLGRPSRQVLEKGVLVYELTDRRLLLQLYELRRSGGASSKALLNPDLVVSSMTGTLRRIPIQSDEIGQSGEARWGILLEPGQITGAMTGTLFGRKERWAVVLRYCDVEGTSRLLISAFERWDAYQAFCALLEGRGIELKAGDPANPMPQVIRVG